MRRLRQRAHYHRCSERLDSFVGASASVSAQDLSVVEAGEVRSYGEEQDEEEEEQPTMSVPLTIGLFIAVAVVSLRSTFKEESDLHSYFVCYSARRRNSGVASG